MSVADLQELEEIKGLVNRGQQLGVLTYAEIAQAIGELDLDEADVEELHGYLERAEIELMPEVERDELQDLMRSVEYPEDWFYVERACVLMFWLAAQLDPGLDTMAEGFPYVMPLLAARAAAAAESAAAAG